MKITTVVCYILFCPTDILVIVISISFISSLVTYKDHSIYPFCKVSIANVSFLFHFPMKTDPADVDWDYRVNGEDAVDQLVHERSLRHGDVRTKFNDAKLAEKRDSLYDPATNVKGNEDASDDLSCRFVLRD